ncbi:MAG: SAM-dependent chlorinase/fluorinase [Candidatus Lambdaproteobacteria bacterium]|nr:SAM-dependent chlorinase/fluorinase [Candidatus Lambdaproteobacteria bacterium]
MNAERARRHPMITLTTDYGTADGFVGAVKGCILTLHPRARLVDISHEIGPQDVWHGAWCLRRAAPRFPPGAVHLVVVDPGVGSERAALIVETARSLLVGPDNGVLSLAAGEERVHRVVRIEESPPRWHRSASFDGLTLFAPVAAHLAAGMAPTAFGGEIGRMVELELPAPERVPGALHGRLLGFDRFGNGLTNISRAHLAAEAPRAVRFGTGVIAEPASHYGALREHPEQPLALWNGDDYLELALYRGSVRERYALAAGDPVTVLLE